MNKSGVAGAMLAAARIKLDYTPEDIAIKLGTTEERIIAIESGKYDKITHDVYSEGLLRKYAAEVGLKEKVVIDHYRQETQSNTKRSSRKRRQKRMSLSPIVTSRISFMIIAGAIFLVVLGYVIFQAFTLTGDPRLSIIFPAENQVVYGQELEIVGTTDPGNEIYIDNRLAQVSEDGDFRFKLLLAPGTHEISIEARNQLGRSARKTRTVFVELSSD